MKAKIVAKSALKLNLEKGKRYAICTCGESSNQPYCDGAHAGTGFVPKVVIPEEDKTVSICQCKQSKTPGFCDGSHNTL